jgi:hypothetical protein
MHIIYPDTIKYSLMWINGENIGHTLYLIDWKSPPQKRIKQKKILYFTTTLATSTLIMYYFQICWKFENKKNLQIKKKSVQENIEFSIIFWLLIIKIQKLIWL